MSLRDMLRNHTSEEVILEVIEAAVKKKKKQHAGTYMYGLKGQYGYSRKYFLLLHTQV